MFQIQITYDDNSTNIDFPCSGETIDEKMKAIGVMDLTNARMFVSKVNDYDVLSFMECDFIDLDELNVLAHRLDAFDKSELQKFECVAKEYNIKSLHELINLTGNMNRYTLIQNMGSIEEIGRVHYLTRNQCMSAQDEKSIDFAKIGRELINSGRGRFTDYGMLFVNDDIPALNIYDGVPTPENMYGDKSIEVSITKDDKKIFLWLPETESTINRMLGRLNTSINDDEYTVQLEYYEGENKEWRERLKEILEDYGFNVLNDVATAINGLGAESELEKLSALMNYAATSEPEDIIKLANNIDKFTFVKGATDYEDLARHLIYDLDDYDICDELEDYLDETRFGEDQMEERNGQFVDNGIVYMKDDFTLQEILGYDEKQKMTMGGM